MMKKWSMCVVLCCCIFMVAAFAEPLQEADWYTEMVEMPANSICVDGDLIYILQNNELWLTDVEFEKQELYRTFTGNVTAIDVQQGEVYYAYPCGNAMSFSVVRGDGTDEALFSVESQCRLLEIARTDNGIIAQWRLNQEEAKHMNPQLRRIVLYDLSGYELTSVYGYDVEVLEGAKMVVLCDDGNPYVWDSASGTLDWLSGTFLGDMITVGHTEQSKVYVVEAADGRVYQYDCNSEQKKELAIWENCNPHFGDLICVGDSLVGYNTRGDMDIVSWPLSEDTAVTRTLTIVNCDKFIWPMLEKAEALFAEKYPDVTIRWETMKKDALNTALMAKPSGVDLFYLDNANIYNMVKSGAVVDLNEDEALSQTLSGWIGAEAMCMNGIRFGVPLEMNADFLLVNDALKQYSPFENLADLDWLQIFEQSEDMRTDLDGDGKQDIWLLWDSICSPMWRWQYIGTYETPEEVDFNTEMFHALAERYKACVQKGLILDYAEYFDMQDMAVYKAGYVSPILAAEDFCPLPQIDGKNVVTGSSASITIAAGSENIDLALEFLRMYASFEVQSADYAIGLMPDSSCYEAYNAMSKQEQDYIEQRKEYLDQAQYQWNILDFNVYANQQMELYLSDQITVEELSESLQQKLQMILWG